MKSVVNTKIKNKRCSTKTKKKKNPNLQANKIGGKYKFTFS